MLLVAYGTRPEWIKIEPILKHLEMPHRKLFTGQHVDIAPTDNDCIKLEIEDGPNRLDSIVRSVLNNDEIYEDIDTVLVQGDTTSVFAVALGAFHRGIKIIHLEAGLRTYNNKSPYPEEFNRRAVSAMADVHLCPTQQDVNALYKEGINKWVYLTGNTVLDPLVDIETSYGEYVLITMHRRENHQRMAEWFKAINKSAQNSPELTFLFPLHPNPNVQKHKHLLTDVQTSPPFHHEDFVVLLANCRYIITDSGGIQEEASFLNKRAIVCREHTERPVGSHVMCGSPEDLIKWASIIKVNYKTDDVCPFGNGYAGKKCASIIDRHTLSATYSLSHVDNDNWINPVELME